MARLPHFLKEYFWDVRFEDLEIKEHQMFILRRLMEHGNENAVSWMQENFTRAELKNALSKYRGYSKKSANFWAFILGMPEEDVLCLKKSSSKTPKNIWPY
jgi:hypothetical protein